MKTYKVGLIRVLTTEDEELLQLQDVYKRQVLFSLYLEFMKKASTL